MTTFSVHSSVFDYTVNMSKTFDEIIQCLDKKTEKILCVIDENVIKYHLNFIRLLQKKRPIFSFTAIEENKTLDGLSLIIQKMKDEGLGKNSHLIVIGGGVTQDVCALAAHLYYRGIAYTFIPTTLLSMADSCIGAKSGLNFNHHKNQLGAFYPPKSIFIFPQFLDSLKISELYSGYGEILKLFIIGGCVEDLGFLLDSDNASSALQPDQISHCIHKALLIKKQYIEEDEFDIGNRRILNYGHTFGHAIETLTQYTIPHGLSIVIGMDIANYIAMKLKLLNEECYNKLNKIMTNFYPWHHFKNNNISLNELIACVKSDKKTNDDKITMALPIEVGKFILKPIEINSTLLNYLTDYADGPGRQFLSFKQG